MKFWLWPNRAIGKRRSGELREEHNKAVQQIRDLREALELLQARVRELPCAHYTPRIHDAAVAATKVLKATKEES